MDEQKKKKKPPTVHVDGKDFPEKPGMLDHLKEGFETTNTRAQLDAIRKRRQRMGS